MAEDAGTVDVDELVVRIKLEAARRRGEAASAEYSSIEELLDVAEARAASRSRRLPLLVARAVAFLSRDRRRIDAALIAALRASVAANRALAERVAALEAGSG